MSRNHCPASHRWRWRIRFEQRTGILVGTYYAPDHWSRRSPLYIGPVGSFDPGCRGYWRQWAQASGVSFSTFGRAAYVVMSRFNDDRDRTAFRLAVLALAITAVTAWLVIS